MTHFLDKMFRTHADGEAQTTKDKSLSVDRGVAVLHKLLLELWDGHLQKKRTSDLGGLFREHEAAWKLCSICNFSCILTCLLTSRSYTAGSSVFTRIFIFCSFWPGGPDPEEVVAMISFG